MALIGYLAIAITIVRPIAALHRIQKAEGRPAGFTKWPSK
jgi:hypothetical protein